MLEFFTEIGSHLPGSEAGQLIHRFLIPVDVPGVRYTGSILCSRPNRRYPWLLAHLNLVRGDGVALLLNNRLWFGLIAKRCPQQICSNNSPWIISGWE